MTLVLGGHLISLWGLVPGRLVLVGFSDYRLDPAQTPNLPIAAPKPADFRHHSAPVGASATGRQPSTGHPCGIRSVKQEGALEVVP